MFFRRDLECTTGGKLVGIYDRANPQRTLREAKPEEADVWVNFLNHHIHAESFICGACGKLINEVVLHGFTLLTITPDDDGSEAQMTKTLGEPDPESYCCGKCGARLENDQLKRMGVR